MKTILQISVQISEEAEEFAADIFQNIFGKSPSIYTHAETRRTTASIYFDKISLWNKSAKDKLLDELKRLRDVGIDPGPCRIVVKKLKREDWAESWKKHFKPIQIGKSLLIKPSWIKLKPVRHQACVILDPGLSFGTGQHATTLFCLQQLVRCRHRRRTQSFLDMGTGSGILAISAAKLGYSPIGAFDFDPESVRISQRNAEQNKVASHVRPVRRDLTTLPEQSKTKSDLICANLIYDVLLSQKKTIVNRLAPDGSLILAGILQSQFEQVKSAYEKLGLKLVATKTQKEWQSGRFVFRKGDLQ